MAIKIDYVCPYCNANHLKDSSVGGDYDEGGMLLSFCPICGRMYHVTLSRKKRKVIGVRLAMRCNLDFDVAKKATNDAPQEHFTTYLIKTLKVVRDDILAVIDIKI